MYLLRVIILIVLLSNCQTDDSKEPVINIDSVVTVTNLSSKVDETSGLINFNNRLITHNDGGDSPNLYEISISTGDVIRTVAVTNAINVDMEDIAQDENYIYLCDVGNNSNNRKDQTIYKISKTDYLAKENVNAEIITISYNEQTDFTKTNRTTNFDAEAVISVGSSLFLFTKNWGDLNTSVYKIPKVKGNYKLTKIDNYSINGLITGADYNINTNTIVLTGYSNFKPFIVKLTDFSQNNPLDGKVEKKSINVNGSAQIEGISANPDNSYYLSAEGSLGLPPVLYKMTLSD